MKVDTIQTSFASGEFGPSLFGRTDIAQYANACALVQNMLPRSYGPAISMPGTRYVATVSDSTLRTRLIPFVFNRTDAYAIEMGDLYMRFFTNRGQVVTKAGTEDLSAFTANLKAHYKMNDNVSGTGSTTVLDAVGTHNGTASTLTSSLSTTAIVSTGFDLQGSYHISVTDHADFTRTASSQPMTIAAWVYYVNNGSSQAICSKAGEYELSVNSSDELSFFATSGDADTKLLLHCDGADASTSFPDSSSAAHTVTANGNAQVDTAQKMFGTGSAFFDGTGDYLSIPDSTDWNLGASGAGNDWTVDFWVRFADVSTIQGLICPQSAAGGLGWQIYFDGTTKFLTIASDGSSDSQVWNPVVDTWYHVALVKSGTTITGYVNGTSIGTYPDRGMNNDSQALYIGVQAAPSAGDLYLNGYLDEIRIVKGTAVWTSNFTPSDTPYQSSVSNSWKSATLLSEGWNFVTVVFKGTGATSSDCKIYIDGEIVTTDFTGDPGFVKMEDTSSLFRIGTTSSAGAKNWKRKLDNLAFIHQELTAAQIASLYSTSPYQITTVFSENEVFQVHYAQLNDIIWLTHPNHPPQKLVRTSANEWAISDAPIIGGPFLDDNTTTITITASATTGTVNLTVTPTTTNLFTRSGSTLGHHNAYWMIGGLAQTNTTTGLQEFGYVQITNVVNGYTATATVIKNLKVSSATAVWAEGAWSAVRGYPSRVTLHDWRLWFGRTNYEPQKLWGSKNFVYEDFALGTEADDDALNLAPASVESNEIQWLASGGNLISGTYGGAFVINSRSAETITPDNAYANEEVGYGCEPIMPKRIGSFLYYVQRFGKKLRELFYFYDQDTYKAVDRTVLAPHILDHGVVEMAVQQNPETILYCVLTSGTLVTMTREVDQDVTAWASHPTAGTYASITMIPSQQSNYDEAWVIVERWVAGSQKKYVEYFENIEVPDRQDQCLYLHSALSFSAYEASSVSSATISLSASSGSVTLTSSTAYFVGAHVGRRIRAINSDGDTLGEGSITATNSTTSITLSITTTFNALSYAAGFWGLSVQTVAGLDHLAAKTVGILADGQVESLTRTVASGAVTLGSNYFVITVGLSYDQILYTLPKEAGTNRGTAQGKIQRINEIALKVNRSTQGFKYGTDSSSLDDVNVAITPSVTTLYTGIIGGLTMRGGYTKGAQVYIKNSNPLPIEILSIMSSLDTNEK
jgi:hypothetical protein